AQFCPEAVCLSNDETPKKSQLQRRYQAALQAGQSIVMDNTHPERASRADWIQQAKAHGYQIGCYFFQFPKLLALHLNQMRIQMGQKQIPDIAIHSYYKRLVPPTLEE